MSLWYALPTWSDCVRVMCLPVECGSPNLDQFAKSSLSAGLVLSTVCVLLFLYSPPLPKTSEEESSFFGLLPGWSGRKIEKWLLLRNDMDQFRIDAESEVSFNINNCVRRTYIGIIEFSVSYKPPYVLPFAFPYTISPYRPSFGLTRPRKILYVYDCIYAVRRQIKEEDFQWGLFGVPSVSLLVSNE